MKNAAVRSLGSKSRNKVSVGEPADGSVGGIEESVIRVWVDGLKLIGLVSWRQYSF